MAELDINPADRRGEAVSDSASRGPLPAASVVSTEASASDALSHLYKMSPTAGVATTDYAAINVVSIVAFLLGLAGVLSLFAPILLIVPAIGLLLGIIALIQIRDSNRTQTGNGFAILGVVLALAFGGFVVGKGFITWRQNRAAEAQISALVTKIGDDLAAGRYDKAYAFFTERFRGRVSSESFVHRVTELNAVPRLGSMKGFRWNGEDMVFESNPDTGDQTVTAMVFLNFENVSDPQREYMKFVRESGNWVIEDIPLMIPSAKPRVPGAPRGPRSGP